MIYKMILLRTKRAQAEPSPPWKDRSGRSPETALSNNQLPVTHCGDLPNAGRVLGLPASCAYQVFSSMRPDEPVLYNGEATRQPGLH